MKLCMFTPKELALERGWPGRIEGDRVIQLAAQTLQSFFTGGGSARDHGEYLWSVMQSESKAYGVEGRHERCGLPFRLNFDDVPHPVDAMPSAGRSKFPFSRLPSGRGGLVLIPDPRRFEIFVQKLALAFRHSLPSTSPSKTARFPRRGGGRWQRAF